MAVGTVSVGLEGSDIARPEVLTPFVVTANPNTPTWNIATGFGPMMDQISERKDSLGDKFQSAKQLRGTDQINALGVPFTEKVKFSSKKDSILILREGILRDLFSFTAADYTIGGINADSTNVTMTLAAPAARLAIGSELVFNTNTVTEKVVARAKTVTDTGGGAATVVFHFITGNVAADITNSVTAKKLRYYGAYLASNSDENIMKNVSASTEQVYWGKAQETIKVEKEADQTTHDDAQQTKLSAGKYMQTAHAMVQGMNNALLIGNGSTRTDAAGNVYRVPTGFLNISGVPTSSASGTGLGPTILNTISDQVTRDGNSPQSRWEMDGGKSIIHVLCSTAASILYDKMLSTSSVFGTAIQVRMGEGKYKRVLSSFETRDAIFVIHKDRCLDDGPYRYHQFFFNTNTIGIVVKKGFFFTAGSSPKNSGLNYDVYGLTTIFAPYILVKEQTYMLTGASALET
jgi:hypothetical protein